MIIRCILVLFVGSQLSGCTNVAATIHNAALNYQSVVNDVNQSIAATAPDVMIACSNLKTAAVLVAPFVPTSTKAQAALAAANGAIAGYCQNIPTDIPSTLAAVATAAKDAQVAYNQVVKGAG